MIYPLDSDLMPVVWGRVWDDISRDPKAQQDEVVRCSEEPWYWLVNYAYTIRRDENVPDPVLERFPPDPYLQYILEKCFREPFLAIDKSRQMRMTWLMMAYYLWHCQFRSYEQITCQTKKEEDADTELIGRAHTIWKHQPAWLKPSCKKVFRKLSFPQTQSEILGIPSGGDQIRSHNPSRHFGDECGFLEGDFDECFAAALACAKDIKLVSSANAGQWEEFINDKKAA